MILDKSFRREAARTLMATLMVFLTVVMTWVLFRILRQSGQGQIDPKDVTYFIVLSMLAYLAIILTMALFLTLLIVLSRWYRESEMVIWLASGVGLRRMIRPVLGFAWPVLLGIAALTLIVWPWANERQQMMRDQFESRGDLARAQPGQFRESADGRRVFFFEGTPGTTQATRVFVRVKEPDVESITLASTGRVTRRPDGLYVELGAGRRYELVTGGSSPGEMRVATFKQYLIKTRDDDSTALAHTPMSATPTLGLLGLPTLPARGELFWRLSIPASAIVLCLLAVPLAAVHPRAGRGWHVVFALLAFLTYYNLTNLGQAWVSQGRLTLPALMAVLHGGALLATAAMLWRKSSGWTLTNMLTRMGTRRRAGT
ncbi:MAG: LPS export ABC transporter permease LptF [Betaproteobacteria bacterium]|nr:LPS export ABC transporter permease LptF [Betaproteobacteria bacterium]